MKQYSTQSVTVITTVRNEANTIEKLLDSLTQQTSIPDEIVIVDAASSDGTVEVVKAFQQAHPAVLITIESFACNRSTGRNRAIDLAQSSLIAITDSGCSPHQNWLEELLKAYQPGHIVAGYAIGIPSSSFQEAVIPYLLVMPDRVNPSTYLPATRSMLLEKKSWQTVGGFDEDLNTSEDFVFAMKLQSAKIPITFAKDAQVDWFPPTKLKQFSKTIVSFAGCDMTAGILRPKVITVYGRYVLMVLFYFALLLLFNAGIATFLTTFGALCYSVWAVKKNKKYVARGWYWLPVLQFIADAGVMIGTGWGAVQYLTRSFRLTSSNSLN